MESCDPVHSKVIAPYSDTTLDCIPESLTFSGLQTNLSNVLPAKGLHGPGPEGMIDDDISSVQRFSHLLDQSKSLIQNYGPYTALASTKSFSRAPARRDFMSNFSEEDIARSFAAAQKCKGAQQVGDTKCDLATFESLWNTTLSVLDLVLGTGDLDHGTFGWGIAGLCAGYINHASLHEDASFLSLKTRLHSALRKMSSREPTWKKNQEQTDGKIHVLAKTNREVHVCATLLLQQFRREKWTRIRWYHAVAVAERWAEHLGLVH
jgi:hypothetical protein